MTDHPILFKADMVRAILDGRKTQTRRVIKDDCLQAVRFEELSSIMNTPPRYKNGKWVYELQSAVDDTEYYEIKSSYGVPGDLLWVRETWAMHDEYIIYRADLDDWACLDDCPDHKWKPSIFMPKTACRLWLKVKSVRVERVQEISEDDAICEGTKGGGGHPDFWAGAFHDLWDSINAKRGYGWDKNPWVWVIEFERYDK